MANTRIRGITIELGADFSEVTEAFKTVTKQCSEVDKNLKDVNKLLKLDPKNVELLGQKQSYLNEAIQLTEKRLEEEQKMLNALPKDPNGNMTEQQKALTREIEATRQKLGNYKTDLKQTEEALKGAEKGTSQFKDTLKALVTADVFKGLINGAKELGTQIWNLGKDTAGYADEVMQLSTQFGLSTDAIQEFKYMSELTDTSLETITGSMVKLTKNMQTASKGTGDAYNAFQQLGIQVTNADGSMRDANEVFAEAIEKLGDVENVTERDALSMNIFGRSASDLNPLIAVGSEELAEYAEEAHNMGYVLDTETLEALGATDDAMQRASKAIDAAKNQIGVYLAPVVAQITEAIAEFASKVDWQAVGSAISTCMTVIGKAVGGAIDIIKTLIDIVGKVVKALKDLFTGNYQFPKIKLPHPYISPRGWKLTDLFSGITPSIGIDWYAKGMEGMILDKPTIFGMDKNGNFMGGGEAGREVIIGENNLLNAIRSVAGGTTINIVVNEATNAQETADLVMNKLQLQTSAIGRSWR